MLGHLARKGALEFRFFGLELLGGGVVHIGHSLQLGDLVLKSVDVVFQLALFVFNLNNGFCNSKQFRLTGILVTYRWLAGRNFFNPLRFRFSQEPYSNVPKKSSSNG